MVQNIQPKTLTPNPDFSQPFPDHTQLPESDGTFVFAERAVGKNFQEHPQTLLLTDSIASVLQQLHPDGQYIIGQDCGIYWRETDPPETGAEAPDWFYIPDVSPKLDGQIRRSYVLRREYIPPLIAIELASRDGSEERDKTSLAQLATVTPQTKDKKKGQRPGKFWVYERVMRIPYYAIFVIKDNELEVYNLVNGFYQKMSPNERGHYPIAPLKVELGKWSGSYQNQTQIWLRWWDSEGNLLLTGQERAEKAEAEVARLRALLQERGIDPDTVL
ncbi:MAG: Uma2 family endonuclease [Moorea sp. SIO3I7]|uniref:Uma2 family endonuclease n=1 Tax=Moorena sp. SIO3I8 TaxID=2607833 RepID=UPI0013C0204B|nr:Uma2 family endonuclease [Moorena sp. SIO3I8]NEN95705.1 Uma2 family endonuclease [Moorena sp. SIO3I7]NEO06452.1 Uma2 family endonuclease [Moorena sp. SIO3I8]